MKLKFKCVKRGVVGEVLSEKDWEGRKRGKTGGV